MSTARKSVREMSKSEMVSIIARLLRDKDELVKALEQEHACHVEAQTLLKEMEAVLDVYREEACRPKPKPKPISKLAPKIDVTTKEGLQAAAKKLGIKIVMVESMVGERFKW